MAATDRMAPKAGKDVVLILAMAGQRSFPGQKGHNLRQGDCIAGCIPVGVSKELPQEVRPGRELSAMSLPPDYILLDCFAQRHASPSRSRAATSRSAD
jgi:hypothetical protein